MADHSPDSQQGGALAQAQSLWLQWVETAFPQLMSRAYFLPPVFIRRVPLTRQAAAGHEVLVLHPATNPAMTSAADQPTPVQESDVRDDAAMQRVLLCVQRLLCDMKEVAVGLTQLQFGQYLGEPSYAAAAAHLPLPANLPAALPRNWRRGDFDVLLIHRDYGFVVCEVKAIGDSTCSVSAQDEVTNIRKKVQQAVSQLDKAEAMLSHLVSDIAPGLRITKVIALPNLTARQVQQALAGDADLTQKLSYCVGRSDPAAICSVCLCSDQLSDPMTPWDISSDVLRELESWWKRSVAGAGHDSHMTDEVYKTLVARFCGPATTVTVPCTCPPRLSVKTLGQAVGFTGHCYAQMALFPEQVGLLNTAPPTVFLAGPPGTGKSVVLLLMAMEWLRRGSDTRIVSTCRESRAACSMLRHLLQQTVTSLPSDPLPPGQVHLLQYDFQTEDIVKRAVDELVQAAGAGPLHVIIDEAGPDDRYDHFQLFCKELLTRVPSLHLWAASCYHGHAPADWPVEYLTRPLRFPPAVARQVEQDTDMKVSRRVRTYSRRSVPDVTDGPPVTVRLHKGQGHSMHEPASNCERCGQDLADFLSTLGVGGGEAAPLTLRFRDVLVVGTHNVHNMSGLVTGLRKSRVPVKVFTDSDTDDLATGRSDVIWVAHGSRVHGLERKIVVCLVNIHDDYDDRLHLMSRCTSQLVILSS